MKNHFTALAIVLFILVTGLYFLGEGLSSNQRERPASVSSDYEWAGGPDGGYWVKCDSHTIEGKQVFSCSIYNEKGDCVLPQGIYAPFTVVWNSSAQEARYEEFSEPLGRLQYNGVDRGMILLDGNLVLRKAD